MLDDELLREIGLKIKVFRIRKQLTQAQLGEMVSMPERRISEIECGKCNLTLKTVNKIANRLKVKPKSLFDFEDI